MTATASTLALFGPLLGGLGLFLLGMALMTDGLKLAAGPALERILARSTRTRVHALGSGALVTALVQSSSAVTVATIGFVNAGLLSLGQALWLLFGANLGTTMTGWLVALVGLKFKIEALALPLVGVGAALRLAGESGRRGALGTAIAGFGLLFLGIDLLQRSFAGLGSTLSLPGGDGALAVLAQLGVGIALTVLMQSSSASIAIALTAAQGGLIGAQGAAAVVIGANIGTTVTAALAALGATPNAHRAAAAHVLFNVVTGIVALALLPWLVSAIAAGRDALGFDDDPAAQLALFHTAFNALGVLLMWPLADRLARWLAARFRAGDEAATPQHLDDTVLAVPTLALDALAREAERIGTIARRMAASALHGADAAALARDQQAAASLDAAATRFVERMHRSAMTPASGERLARLLRVVRYHETTAEQALEASRAPQPPLAGDALAARQAFQRRADALLAALPSRDALPARLADAEAAYQALKAALLAAGADGRLAMAPMEAALRRASALRRALQQAAKAALAEPVP